MAKDRARPFSRKHRKYWIPITGGMILIGALNVGIGYCSYTPPGPPPQRIIPVLPPPGTAGPSTDGTIGLGEIPAVVMRAFAVAYPRHIPSPKKLVGPDGAAVYELSFSVDAHQTVVTYQADGTFVRER